MTIQGIIDMTPDQYIARVLPAFGITHTDFFPSIDRGMVEVR
jgi:hypothetical protein